MKGIAFVALMFVATFSQAGVSAKADTTRKNLGSPCMMKVGQISWINGNAVTHIETRRGNVYVYFGYGNYVALDYGTEDKATAGVGVIAELIKATCQ